MEIETSLKTCFQLQLMKLGYKKSMLLLVISDINDMSRIGMLNLNF